MKKINYIWRFWICPLGIASSIVAFLDKEPESGIILLLILFAGTIIKLLYLKEDNE